jgi:hypothetical protein
VATAVNRTLQRGQSDSRGYERLFHSYGALR